MKKNLHYIALIIFCTLGASIPLFVKADIFEELFKDIDFEQLTKDMEKMFGEKEDTKDLGPKMEPIPSKTQPTTATGDTENTENQQTSKKDRRELFLDPDIRKVNLKGGKSITEPTKTSRAALSSYKKEMDEKLKTFEKNVEANKSLSLQFKERVLPELKKQVDEIVVASEMIDSKKVYQNIFMTPSSDVKTKEKTTQMSQKNNGSPLSSSMKQLRQRYLTLIDELDSLNKKIQVTEAEESKETDKEKLEDLAGQESTELPEYTPLVPSKTKVRGVKPTQQKRVPKRIVPKTPAKTTPIEQFKFPMPIEVGE